MVTINVETPEIGEILSTLRERGWSDIAIAQAMNINRTTIWRWRIGARTPHTGHPVAMALMTLLSVPPPAVPGQNNS